MGSVDVTNVSGGSFGLNLRATHRRGYDERHY